MRASLAPAHSLTSPCIPFQKLLPMTASLSLFTYPCPPFVSPPCPIQELLPITVSRPTTPGGLPVLKPWQPPPTPDPSMEQDGQHWAARGSNPWSTGESALQLKVAGLEKEGGKRLVCACPSQQAYMYVCIAMEDLLRHVHNCCSRLLCGMCFSVFYRVFDLNTYKNVRFCSDFPFPGVPEYLKAQKEQFYSKIQTYREEKTLMCFILAHVSSGYSGYSLSHAH